MKPQNNIELLTRIAQSPAKQKAVRSALTLAKLKTKHDVKFPFVRKERKRRAKASKICAYDFETTNIAKGTPRPLYLTAFSPDFQIETRIRDMKHLTQVLITQFLTDDNAGTKFVGWNANRFDAYFIAAALVLDDDYTIRPYLTRSKSLRGMRVIKKRDADGVLLDPHHAPAWEFLDGIAMLGLTGVSLEKFLLNFAPDHAKLSGVIDFDAGETFNYKNPDHCAYAMRDSVGLYHGMTAAQKIMLDNFNEPLAVTMGGVCIKIFAAHMPPGTVVYPLIPDVDKIVREYVMRGGFCYLSRRYTGPVWKYDINQAYASAMREAKLPSGNALKVNGAPNDKAQVFIAQITATNPESKIPFYCRSEIGGRIRSQFCVGLIEETWITSIEYRQLQSEGWKITCFEFWQWSDSFSMKDYVDKLERLRGGAIGGPSGAAGTMFKATGNHSYGKSVENVEPIEYVLARECPADAFPFYDIGPEPISHLFYRMDLERKAKAHHQPHLGAFITAHVRMVLRRMILLNPESWLYADTDCLVFDCDMSGQMDIDPKRYGAWKIEESGTVFQLIAKKVYAEVLPDGEPRKAHVSAKGMNVRKLNAHDFARWQAGEPPMQNQIQLNNFLAVLCGADMYRAQERSGTAIKTPLIA